MKFFCVQEGITKKILQRNKTKSSVPTPGINSDRSLTHGNYQSVNLKIGCNHPHQHIQDHFLQGA